MWPLLTLLSESWIFGGMTGQPAHLAPFSFTSASAAQAARKRYEMDAQRNAELEAARQASALAPEAGYLNRRLLRVREQIERVSGLLDKENDPQKLDRLAAALERLSDLERTLDNRPLPGSRRPGREPSKRMAAPADPEPDSSPA